MSTIGIVTEVAQTLSSLDYFLPKTENEFGLRYSNLQPQELLALHIEATAFITLHELSARKLVSTIYDMFPEFRVKYPNWQDFLGGYELSGLSFHNKLDGVIRSSDIEMLLKYGTSLRVLKDREGYRRAKDLVEGVSKAIDNVRNQVQEIEEQRKAKIYSRWFERGERLHNRFPKIAKQLGKIL